MNKSESKTKKKEIQLKENNERKRAEKRNIKTKKREERQRNKETQHRQYDVVPRHTVAVLQSIYL
jgi:hypothetical protein